MKHKALIFLSIVFLMCSCGPKLGTNESDEFVVFEDINLEETITFSDISQRILVPKCKTCHNWTEDKTIARSNAQRIVAGDPESSNLYIRTNSGSMPLGGPALTNEELDLIYRFLKDLE